MKVIVLVIFLVVKVKSEDYEKVETKYLLNFIEDSYLDFVGLAQKYKYPVYKYDVKTEDGYILTVFRIQSRQKLKNKGPVLLQHGITDSADTWTFPGTSIGLGYLLADSGYDVWCGNVRGNKYSRKHEFLDPDKDKAFWDYSFHEMGIFDLPAMIDFILNTTGFSKLKYVGHSQGTTMFYTLCSLKPEYNQKISLSISLAPIAWLSNAQGPVMKLAASSSKDWDYLIGLLGPNEIFSASSPSKKFKTALCQLQGMVYPLCGSVTFLLNGYDPDQLTGEMVAKISGHVPSGTSRKSLVHYMQIARNKTFSEFDYGDTKNIQRYASRTPPEYNVGKITAPVALFCSKNDWFSSLKDVDVLKGRLPNVVDYYVVPDVSWNHIDYVWGKDTRKYVGHRMVKLLNEYELTNK